MSASYCGVVKYDAIEHLPNIREWVVIKFDPRYMLLPCSEVAPFDGPFVSAPAFELILSRRIFEVTLQIC